MLPIPMMILTAAFGMLLLVIWAQSGTPGYWGAYFSVIIAVDLIWIIAIGYPGDGPRGLQTAWGRAERSGQQYQYANGYRERRRPQRGYYDEYFERPTYARAGW